MSSELDRKAVQRAIDTYFSQLNGDPMLVWRVQYAAQRVSKCNNILPFEKRSPCKVKSDFMEQQGGIAARESNNKHD